MKRNLLLLLCILALVASCLASCKPHEHEFETEWYGDETSHWHRATCEHGEIRDSLGDHVDVDENSVCDVCEAAVKHLHTFVTEWSYDDDYHWKVATCSHADEKGEFALHSDENLDGLCDLCPSHVHNVNAAGYCTHTDCGKKVREIDETNINELMGAILVQQKFTNGGNIDYQFEGRSNTSSDYFASRREVVDYIFGKDNYTYMKVTSNAVNAGTTAESVLESWNQLTSPDTTFGVYSENGGAIQLDMSNPDKLNGYYIALSTLAGEYGVEPTLYALYQVAVGDTATDLEVIPDTAENKITFKYNYKTVFVNTTQIAVGDNVGSYVHNVNYFEVQVTVFYNDDYVLTGLGFVCDSYTNDPGTSDRDGFLYKDVDLEYDPDTDTFIFVEYLQDENGNWYYVPTDKRTPDTYTITITQTVGERTEENPNPRSKFVPTGYDLYMNMDEKTGELSNLLTGDIIEVDVRDTLNFYVGECRPEGTSIHFVADLVSFEIYRNNVLVENPTAYDNQIAVAMFTFAGSQRSFFFIPKMEGAYKMVIYLMGEKTHEINVHAGPVDEEFVEIGDGQFAAKVTETYEWANRVTFTAEKAGTYYFNLPAGVGFINAKEYDEAQLTPSTFDGPIPYYDYNQNQNPDGSYIPGSFSLYLEAGESIDFYVMSNKARTYVIEFFVG